MKRLFLLTAIVTLACSNEAPSTNDSDPQSPEAEVPNAPADPSLEGHQGPNASETESGCSGETFGRDCEPVVEECLADTESDPENCGACGNSCDGGSCVAGECRPPALYTAEGTGDHWLAMAGERLLLAEPERDRVLELFPAGGEASTLAASQPGAYWLGSDGERVVWTTSDDQGAAFRVQELRTGKQTLLATGIEQPEFAVFAEDVVVWQDWSSHSLLGVAVDEPERIITLANDVSAHAPAIDGGFVYYASEQDQGSIRRVELSSGFAGAEDASELVAGQLSQRIPGFGSFRTRDLQVSAGNVWFQQGVEGGAVWHIDANGEIESIGGQQVRARHLTLSKGWAFWVTYAGSDDAREGALWAAPAGSGVELGSVQASESQAPRIVADHVGWVQHLLVSDGSAYFSTSRVPNAFSVEKLKLDMQ